MAAVFTSDQLFVQPTAPSRWDIKMSAKPNIPANHDRATIMNIICTYNYYLSNLEIPALVWLTSKVKPELVTLAKSLMTTVKIVTVSPEAASTRRRAKNESDFTDLRQALTSLKDYQVCLFWVDPVFGLSDEQAVSEIISRAKIIDEYKPAYFVTDFKWYTPRIVIDGGELPPRYVEFFSGQLFKTPWSNQTNNYSITIIGTSDKMMNYDWYDIYGKLAYHTNITRVTNRYKSPLSTGVKKQTLTIQTTKIYEEYSNQWDATAELQLLMDLTNNQLVDVALISTATTTAISTPVLDNSVYNLYQRLISS